MKYSRTTATCPIPGLAPLLIGTLSAALCLHAAVAAAPEQMARVDISSGSNDPIDFEVIAVSDGASAGTPQMDSGRKYFSVQLPASGEWQTGSVTILPAQSGRLNFTLLGPYILADPDTKELKPVLIDYDDVRADTAVVKNGGFEASQPDGSLTSWGRGDIPSSKPPLDETIRGDARDGDASEGSRFLRVWHNSRFSQGFFVEEKVPMKLTFMYRLAE